MHTFWSSVFDFFAGNRSSKLNVSVVKVNFCLWVFFKKFPSVLNFMIDGNPKSWVRFLQTFVTTIWSLQYIFPLYRNLIIISRSSFNNEGQTISTLQHSVQVSMHASVQVIFCQKHSIFNQLTQIMTTDCSLNYEFSYLKEVKRKLHVQFEFGSCPKRNSSSQLFLIILIQQWVLLTKNNLY